MDITSCDLETRNVLLLTLLLDDSDGQKVTTTGTSTTTSSSVRPAMTVLLKLHSLAASPATWRDIQYGKLVRLCDPEVETFHISAATESQAWMKSTFRVTVRRRNKIRMALPSP
ncbi:hypothetical protein VTI74DRAFT_4051 [Chaetomium olivicolor]